MRLVAAVLLVAVPGLASADRARLRPDAVGPSDALHRHTRLACACEKSGYSDRNDQPEDLPKDVRDESLATERSLIGVGPTSEKTTLQIPRHLLDRIVKSADDLP